MSPGVLVRLFVYGSLVVGLLGTVVYATWMPGGTPNKNQTRGSVASDQERSGGRLRPNASAAISAQELRKDVTVLAEEIGERNVAIPNNLARARDYLLRELEALSCGTGRRVRRETVTSDWGDSQNIVMDWGQTDPREPRVVVGAHYDTHPGTPGADDNASGVAVTLAMARRFCERRHHQHEAAVSPPRVSRKGEKESPEESKKARAAPAKGAAALPLSFVFFTNEEQPFFQSDSMGSVVRARSMRRARRKVKVMISVESVGYFSKRSGSQNYPFPIGLFYPSEGDFIALVGNLSSASEVRRAVKAFRSSAVPLRAEGAALPEGLPGVGWSDHWAFWQEDYPALMVTDTAPYRNANYHEPTDVAATLDYDKMAQVAVGLERVIDEFLK